MPSPSGITTNVALLQDEDPRRTGPEATGIVSHVTLARPFGPDGGYAFTVPLPEHVCRAAEAGSVAIVCEDGQPIGPGDAIHETIRREGAGAYSVWGSHLYFSASDGSDCNRNGRNYSAVMVDLSPGSTLETVVRQRFAKSDDELLDLIAANNGFNKSVFSNFFGYFNYFAQVLARNGIALPASALELGCGERPYTALRFLAEGAQRCVANDIAPVQAAFRRPFIDHLQTLSSLASPESGARLAALMRPEPGGGIGIRGLDVHGGCPFEELTLDETFDFIYSVSVLEHVMKPEAVVRQMRRLLKPGGHACHSVDLRDHASFDDPLRFLRMAEGEYAGQATENRLRASDWFRLFDAAGFRLLECEYATYDQPGGLAASYSWAPPAPQAWVQAQQRDSFVAPFTEKTPQDLSVLAIRILYERT